MAYHLAYRIHIAYGFAGTSYDMRHPERKAPLFVSRKRLVQILWC